MKTSSKLALLATLYVSQGLPFGFFSQALPVLLREDGVSLGAIGMTSMLAMPWALKFLWAPWIDSKGTHWKSWIVPLQLAASVVLALIALIDGASGLTWLLVAVFITNLLAATQDIATDGMAVDMLSPDERGLGNGIQVAGYRIGMIVGGGALLVVFHHAGWAITFVSAAAILAIATIPIALHREAPRHRHDQPGQRPRLREFAKRPGMGIWLAILFTYKFGDALAGGMLRPFLSDLGLELDDIGYLLGGAGFTAGLLGAVAGGALIGRLGRRTALLIFGTLQAFAVALYVLPATGTSTMAVLYLVCSIDHFAGGMATAALFTMMMDNCRPGAGATDYTIQASVVVIATGFASAISGFIAGAVGYTAHFSGGAIACFLAVVFASRALSNPKEH